MGTLLKKVAILQSNYIPWKGYFDLIASVDEFILYDEMQFTKNDWRNRNLIKTPAGLKWLSIPVGDAISRTIREVRLPAGNWAEKHRKTLQANYGRAAHYGEIAAWFDPLLERCNDQETLSGLNRALIEAVCSFLHIDTKISNSWDYVLGEGKTERLVNLCRQAGATSYVSGPAARSYLDASQFADAGISVEWHDYGGYPPYPQLWGSFEHGVTVLDLLFNCGASSGSYMKFERSGA